MNNPKFLRRARKSALKIDLKKSPRFNLGLSCDFGIKDFFEGSSSEIFKTHKVILNYMQSVENLFKIRFDLVFIDFQPTQKIDISKFQHDLV